ncbi:MAG: hypothetical protein KAV25_00570 [Methanophagales archaeon]|nr:hypothetical protein [Methanophagales archaeon]
MLTGELYVRVFDRHRSKEFIEYLKYLDSAFPPEMKLVITLDNHSAHTSKETDQGISINGAKPLLFCIHANACLMAQYY